VFLLIVRCEREATEQATIEFAGGSMRGTTQKVVTATLAFVLATQSLWTYAQTGNRTRLSSPAEIQPAQTVPPSEPSANWPEVTERLNHLSDAPSDIPNLVETPALSSNNITPFAAQDQPAADATLIIPPSASRTSTHRTTLALPLTGSTLNASIAYLNQATSSASQGSALSSVDVLFRFAFDAGAKQGLTHLHNRFGWRWTTAPC
jgi:hypothetical protein